MLVFLLIYQMTFIIKTYIKSIDIEHSKIFNLFDIQKLKLSKKVIFFRNSEDAIPIVVSPLNAKKVTIKHVYVKKYILIFIKKNCQNKLFIITIVFMLSQHVKF